MASAKKKGYEASPNEKEREEEGRSGRVVGRAADGFATVKLSSV